MTAADPETNTPTNDEVVDAIFDALRTSSDEKLWNTALKLESIAEDFIRPHLEPLAGVAASIYSLSVRAGLISVPSEEVFGANHCALYVKRSIGDFRVVWTLLRSGYTPQAASVAASLWEHSRAAVAIASDLEFQDRVRKSPAETPWGNAELSVAAAKEQLRWTASVPGDDWNKRLSDNAKAIYVPYLVLCKAKHPNTRHLVYEAASSLMPTGEYLLMSFPDWRADDASSKRLIAAISVACLGQAAQALVRNWAADGPERTDWLARASTEMVRAVDAIRGDSQPFHQLQQADWGRLEAIERFVR